MNQITQRPPLSDSTFYMLRAIVALIHADKMVKAEEIHFLDTLITHIGRTAEITDAQKSQLRQDLDIPVDITALLRRVTDRQDLENFVLFGGMLAMADGDMHPAEETILNRVRRSLTGETTTLPELFTEGLPGIVTQEAYGRALAGSGIAKHSRVTSMADALAAKDAGAETLAKEEARLSSSMRHTLLPGEKILAKARFHMMYMVETAIVAIVIALLTRYGIEQLFKMVVKGVETYEFLEPVAANPWWPIAWRYAGVLLGGIVFSYRMLRRCTTEIVLTDRRLLYKRGILFVRFLKIDLRQLFQTEVSQSRIGTMLNYGSVYIRVMITAQEAGREAENVQLPSIKDPHVYASTVDRAKRMLRAREG